MAANEAQVSAEVYHQNFVADNFKAYRIYRRMYNVYGEICF